MRNAAVLFFLIFLIVFAVNDLTASRRNRVHKTKTVVAKARSINAAFQPLSDPFQASTKISQAVRSIQQHFTDAVSALKSACQFHRSAEAVDNQTTSDKFSDKNITHHLFGISVSAEIGTPGQYQDLLFSFLTSHFWVVSERVKFSNYIKNCFNERMSVSLSKSDLMFKLTFSEYSASGFYVKDTVKLGNYTVVEQSFGIADSVNYAFPVLQVNGVLGLAATKDGKENVLGDLLASAQEPVLTFYHNPLSSTFSTSANDIFVTFGGWDETLCQNDWKPVRATNNGFWQLEVNGMTINDYVHNDSTPGKALIISAFPITLVPRHVFTQIVEALGAVGLKRNAGIYIMLCWSLPTIYFHIDGQQIPLQPDDYVIRVYGVCFLRIIPIDELFSRWLGIDYVFAEPLFRSNCVRFAPSTTKISFATPIPL